MNSFFEYLYNQKMNISTTYIDNHGNIEANTEYLDDKFILNIEGSEFTSESLGMFQRFNGINHKRIELGDYNQLLNCKLKFRLPVKILKSNKDYDSFLELTLTYGNENEGIILQKLQLEETLIEIKNGHWLEVGLLKLIELLPTETKLKCCFSCSYSDYSVYGFGFFGCMICYRNAKKEYLEIKDKDDYVELIDKGVGFYLETYLCKEFEPRKKGIKYRIWEIE